MAKRSGRKEVAISAGGAGGANPLVLRGARTIRTLSARYIADLQDHWEIHGKEALTWQKAHKDDACPSACQNRRSADKLSA